MIDRAATLEFMDSYPNLRDWSILLAYRGSISHGTYVPNSDPNSTDDIDLMGVVVPPDEYYYGLREFGSRGTVDDMVDEHDIVLYESRKALTLLAKGNPNIISLLWMDPGMYLCTTEAGRFLIEERATFSTKAAYAPFRGYARSQMEKMTHGAHQGYMGKKRKALVEKYGYDTKNASHLIRLLRQGVHFMRTGEAVVKRPDAEELLEIKRGEWTLELVRAFAEQLERELETAYFTSSLPEAPDMDHVNYLATEVVKLTREEQNVQR